MTTREFNRLSYRTRFQYISNGFPKVAEFITRSAPTTIVRIYGVQRFFVERAFNLETQEFENVTAFKSVAYLRKYSCYYDSLKRQLRAFLDVQLPMTPLEEEITAPFEFHDPYTALDYVILSLCIMDAKGLAPYMADDGRFDRMTKKAFIEYQERVFADLREQGDWQLLMEKSECTGCYKGTPIYVFTGNKSGFRHAFNITFDGELVTELYRCSSSSDWLDWMMPF